MTPTLIQVLGPVVLLVVLVLGCQHYWDTLVEAPVAHKPPRFLVWFARGLLFPSVLWIALNVGLLFDFPALIPEAHAALVRFSEWDALMLTAPSLFVLGAIWAMVSLFWVLGVVWLNTETKSDVIGVMIFWALCSALFVVGVIALWGMSGLAPAFLLWLVPTVHTTLPLVDRSVPRPFYARAVALMKFGKYRDAEVEVLGQLEKSETDFDGWMMLAELYATQFGELNEADRTIRELCRQPDVSVVQAATAVHRLADWHLKIGSDPEAARRALALLGERWPESHSAALAQARLAQLPADREELEEQRKGRRIRLTALSGLEQEPAGDAPPPGQEEMDAAAARAGRCVQKLNRNPNDVEAREEFALLLAQPLGRVVDAVEQIQLLIDLPEPAPAKKAEWLGQIAVWQMRLLGQPEQAKSTLEKIVADFSTTPQAFAAQRQLNLIEMDDRSRRALSRASRST